MEEQRLCNKLLTLSVRGGPAPCGEHPFWQAVSATWFFLSLPRAHEQKWRSERRPSGKHIKHLTPRYLLSLVFRWWRSKLWVSWKNRWQQWSMKDGDSFKVKLQNKTSWSWKCSEKCASLKMIWVLIWSQEVAWRIFWVHPLSVAAPLHSRPSCSVRGLQQTCNIRRLLECNTATCVQNKSILENKRTVLSYHASGHWQAAWRHKPLKCKSWWRAKDLPDRNNLLKSTALSPTGIWTGNLHAERQQLQSIRSMSLRSWYWIKLLFILFTFKKLQTEQLQFVDVVDRQTTVENSGDQCLVEPRLYSPHVNHTGFHSTTKFSINLRSPLLVIREKQVENNMKSVLFTAQESYWQLIILVCTSYQRGSHSCVSKNILPFHYVNSVNYLSPSETCYLHVSVDVVHGLWLMITEEANSRNWMSLPVRPVTVDRTKMEGWGSWTGLNTII